LSSIVGGLKRGKPTIGSLLLMSSLFLSPTLPRQERQANLGLTPILYPEISLKTGKK